MPSSISMYWKNLSVCLILMSYLQMDNKCIILCTQLYLSTRMQSRSIWSMSLNVEKFTIDRYNFIIYFICKYTILIERGGRNLTITCHKATYYQSIKWIYSLQWMAINVIHYI